MRTRISHPNRHGEARQAVTQRGEARREESGFTLIELLIVIVILGILAAVVVFAVNGIQNRGTASACKADVETVTVAAEAFDAQNGYYAKDMDSLVSAGFLHSVPSNSNYTIDYKPNDHGGVDVSSSSCPAPDAGAAQTSDSPSTDNPSSDTPSSQDPVSYCDAYGVVANHYSSFDFQPLHVAAFQKAETVIENVAAVAPDSVSGDWKAILEGFHAAQQAIAATGLSNDDVLLLSQGQLPAGITQDQANQLFQTLQNALSNGQFNAAIQDIASYGSNQCSINIGG